MQTFKDSAGRNWTVSLTLGTAMHVRDKLGVDLLQPEAGDPPLITRIGTDEILLGEILCALLEDQFEANKVTEADVRNSFDGATILAAQKAFYEELVTFFQSRGRTDRANAVTKQAALIEKAIAAIDDRISILNVEDIVHGAMSGDSPAHLA